MSTLTDAGTIRASGRYVIHFADHEVGEERWRVEPVTGGRGAVATGDQLVEAPHPIPGRLEWRARLSPLGRVTALELRWSVGERTVSAEHAADGDLWRVRVDYAGHRREQEGDYPTFCEILLGTHLFHAFALRRYALEPGAEHEFPALVIGPPWMAVEPGRQRVVCTARAELDTPLGRVPARRIEMHDLTGGVPPFSLWIDPHDLVLESYEDLGTANRWMRLVECTLG